MLPKSIFDKAGFSVVFCITLSLLCNKSAKHIPAWSTANLLTQSSECWESSWAWGTKSGYCKAAVTVWVRLGSCGSLKKCCKTEDSASLWTFSQRSFSSPRGHLHPSLWNRSTTRFSLFESDFLFYQSGRKCSDFKGSCDSMRPTWLTQYGLPILRPTVPYPITELGGWFLIVFTGLRDWTERLWGDRSRNSIH